MRSSSASSAISDSNLLQIGTTIAFSCAAMSLYDVQIRVAIKTAFIDVGDVHGGLGGQ